MAKKIDGFIKLQIKAGQASPAPPIGPALGQKGVNIMEFCKAFNAQTQDRMGLVLPVVITVFADKSFNFIVKSPPAAVLLKQAANLQSGAADPLREKVGQGHVGPVQGDRRAQDGRPQRAHASIRPRT